MPSPLSGSGAVGAAHFCRACQLACTGPVSWNQHLQSAKHLKKSQQQSSDGLEAGNTSPPGAEPYFCNHCRLSCSGYEPWTQHIQSAKHIKRVADARKAQVNSRPATPESHGVVAPPPPAPEPPAPPAPPAPPPPPLAIGNLYCTLCSIRCSGTDNWTQHVTSAKHIKRSVDTGAAPAQSIGSAGDVAAAAVGSLLPQPSTDFYCDLCRLACSGPEPWKQHLESAKHMKNVSRNSGGGEQAATSLLRPMPTFSGEPSIAQRAFWPNTTPEGLPVAPSSSSDAIYFCDFCQLSCTGPAPYRQHVESARHLKMVTQFASNGQRGAQHAAAPISPVMPPDLRPLNISSPPSCAQMGPRGQSPLSGAIYSPGTGVATYSPETGFATYSPEPGGAAYSPDAGVTNSPAAGGLTYSPEASGATYSPEAGGTTYSPEAGGAMYFCSVCHLSCSGPAPYRQHLDSAKHLKKVAMLNRRSASSGSVTPASVTSRNSSRCSSPEVVRRPSLSRATPSSSATSPFTPSIHPAILSRSPAEDNGSRAKRAKGAEGNEYGVFSQAANVANTGPQKSPGCSSSSEMKEELRRCTTSSVLASDEACDPSSYGRMVSAGSGRRDNASLTTLFDDDGGSDEIFDAVDFDICQRSTGAPNLGRKNPPTSESFYQSVWDKLARTKTSAPSPLPPDARAESSNRTVYSRRRMRYTYEQISASCSAIRTGSYMFNMIDRDDGISQRAALETGDVIKTLPLEGVIAFLEDFPVLYAHEPLSLNRC